MNATVGPHSELAAEFHQRMIAIYREAKRLGYRSQPHLSMVADLGGVKAATQMVMSNAAGFDTLWEMKRLDLTTEAAVIDPRFSALFEDEVVERARDRLKQAGYQT